CGAAWQRASFGTKRPWVQIPPPRPIEIAGQDPSEEGSSASSGLAPPDEEAAGRHQRHPDPRRSARGVEWGTGQRRWRLLAACDTPRMREEEIFRAIAVRVAALDYRDQVFVRPGYLDADGGWVLTPPTRRSVGW